jgi:PIN domain nuclease of toxin-antitoxin system
MQLLLDTHIWIWSLAEPDKLTSRVSRAVRNPKNGLWLSPLSIWEFHVLAERRKIVVNPAAGEWIKLAFEALPVKEAPVTTEVALAAREMASVHRDPVDVLLAATAKVLDLTLVTGDERLLGIKGISTMPNR